MVNIHQLKFLDAEIRNRRRERRLWEHPNSSLSLGCPTCPQFALCGGLHTIASLFDCMGHCCLKPENCSTMCRLKPIEFVKKVREVGGLSLTNVPRAGILTPPNLPSMIPLIYHGNRRERIYTGPAVALSLHRLLNRASGEPKFASEADLRRAFKLSPDTTIILSGTDQDPPLERWWGYGESVRLDIIRSLKNLGVSLVTTPNYSLFANSPRWDDLHSMKRISLINNEFLQAGLVSALHVNARSDSDHERWTSFVQQRPEITHLAYEFTTGSGRVGRREVHANWLASLAKKVQRPLTIIIRGSIEVLPILTSAFDEVIFLETSAFMKTMNRQSARLNGNMKINWEHVHTTTGASLDDLFEHNVHLKN